MAGSSLNRALQGTWPYDEMTSLITMVLQDGVIDEKDARERAVLEVFWSKR